MSNLPRYYLSVKLVMPTANMPPGTGRKKDIAWEAVLPLENVNVVKDLIHMYLIIFLSRNVQ